MSIAEFPTTLEVIRARHGVLDDYYPSSLLQAALLLSGQDNGYDLPRAIACVSHVPAQAAG